MSLRIKITLRASGVGEDPGRLKTFQRAFDLYKHALGRLHYHPVQETAPALVDGTIGDYQADFSIDAAVD